MGEYKITKAIEFCYGHRLLSHKGKCRYLHGHNGHLEIDVTACDLDDLGMVRDFADVQETVKGWIDQNLDHRMILNKDDVFVSILESAQEPVFVLDDNPTAENIARLVYEQAESQGLAVSEVRLWETPTSCATYRK